MLVRPDRSHYHPGLASLALYLQLLWEEALAGSGEDRHELLKRKKRIALLKLNAEVRKLFDVGHKGSVVEWVKPEHTG